MYERQMASIHQTEDLWSGHASLEYNDIEQAGPPTRPLDFPMPHVHRALLTSVTAYDASHACDYTLDNVIVPLPFNSRCPRPDRAYLVKRKISKTTCGSIRLCQVLRPYETTETDDDDDDDEKEYDDKERWETTNEMVAVKCSRWTRIRQFRGKHMEDPMKEVAALQYTGNYHANILGCLEVLQDDDYLYTVMPYCSGGDLYTKIIGNTAQSSNIANCVKTQTKRVDEDQARIWFRQLLQALFHLQKKGVCHRDISLENVLLDGDNTLTLIDFGLALRVPYTDRSNLGGISDVSEGSLRRLMLAQGQCGNLAFLAPEIVERDEAFDGFAVDLWSVGVILFILLVGAAPFRWAHSTDVRYEQISMGRLRELVTGLNIPLSYEAFDLLQNMLWRDPRDRLNLAQIMHHPWVVGCRASNENELQAEVDVKSPTKAQLNTNIRLVPTPPPPPTKKANRGVIKTLTAFYQRGSNKLPPVPETKSSY